MPVCAFVDTQVFRRLNLHFSGAQLQRLSRLGRHGGVKILLTDVVENEVVAALRSQWQEIDKAQEKLNKMLRPFVHSTEAARVKLPLDSSNLDAADSIFKHWISRSRVEVISTAGIHVQELTSMYFQGEAPFSESKKHEFPDAITLLALRDWAENNNESVHVISADSDLSKFCERYSRLDSIESLAELLDQIFSQEEPIAELVHEILSINREFIAEEIVEDYSDEGLWDHVMRIMEIEGHADDEDWPSLNPVITDSSFGEIRVLELLNDSVLVSVDAKFKWQSKFGSEVIKGIVSDTTYYEIEYLVHIDKNRGTVDLTNTRGQYRVIDNEGYNILVGQGPASDYWLFPKV